MAAALALAALGGLGGPASSAAVAAAEVGSTGPIIEVLTPGPFGDRQPVEVVGSGYEPGAQLVVTQCAGAELATCAAPPSSVPGYFPPNVALPRAGADGTFRVTILLFHEVRGLGDGSDACATGCGVQAVVLDGLVVAARTPVEVGEEPYRWPEATLEADLPGRGLLDGQLLALEGTGYSPFTGLLSLALGPRAWTTTCRVVDGEPDPEADCVVASVGDPDAWVARSVRVDPDGGARGSVVVDRFLSLPDGRWDCALGGCTLALTQDGNPESAPVPLEWAPEWAPWVSASAFLRALYAGVLGRGPTAAELAAGEAQLGSRAVTGVDKAVRVAGATAADATIGEVARQYVAFFGRRPDTPGLRHWVDRMRSGATVASLVASFGRSSELRATYAGLTPDQIVVRAYQRTLGRAPDAVGRAFWVEQLRKGMTVAGFVGRMARSEEFRRREAAHALVTALTFGLAGRTAPTAQQWSHTPEQVARDLFLARA